MRYIDADKLIAEIERLHKEHSGKYGCDEVGLNLEYLEDFIDSLQQEQQKLYKDESLGSPDYERGFKHGRDYQTCVERKYTNKEKVIAYLIDKGYPVSTNGEIPTYQETFDIIKSAIEYANKQEQPEVDLEKEIEDYINGCLGDLEGKEIAACARYFYNLGLNTKEPEPQGLDEAKLKSEIEWEWVHREKQETDFIPCAEMDKDEFIRFAKKFFEIGKDAGAKWMAEQGVTSEGIVEEQSHSAGLTGRYFVAEVERNKLDDFINDNFKPGDQVIVQIRKKEK